MKSVFTLKEVGTMLNMSVKEVKDEIEKGQLSYTFHDGEKKLTLYDLEKYMGEEQTRQIIRDFLRNN